MPVDMMLPTVEPLMVPNAEDATTATLAPQEQEPVTFSQQHQGNGYEYQAMEVMRCLRAGETESPGMSLDESIVIMQTMDRIRAQWGLKYPMD